MKKYILLCGLLLCILGCKQPDKNTEIALLQKAQRIHLDALTIDTHDDINVANFTDSLNYSQLTDTQINIPKMQQGGLDVAWLIVYTGQGELNAEAYKKAAENAQAKFDAIHRLTEVYAPNKIGLATSVATVNQIRMSGRKVAMIGVEKCVLFRNRHSQR